MKNGVLRVFALFIATIALSCLNIDAVVENNRISLDKLKVSQNAKIIPLAIIGAGPAGLSAAIYTSRAKIHTVVFTDNNLGGNLNSIKMIENFPGKDRMSGRALSKDLKKQAQTFGTLFDNDRVTEVDFNCWPFTLKTKKGNTFKALSVIIATGFKPKVDKVPGVKKYWAKGVGVCTICDAAFCKDDDVAVVGGDDYAAEKALQLAAYAKKIYMVIKEPQLQATGSVQDYLKQEKKINFLFNKKLAAIVGDENEVTGIKVKDIKTGDVQDIPVQFVFVAAKYIPNSSFCKNQLVLDKKNYVKVKCRSQKTSVDGVFAAGTVEDEVYGKAAVESGRGMQAALEAIDYMTKKVGYNTTTAKKLPLYYPKKDIEHKLSALTNLADLKPQLEKNKIVVVDVYSKMCTTCRKMKPIMKAFGHEYKDSQYIKIFKAEVDEAKDIAEEYNIKTVPTVLFFKDGKPVNKIKGKTTLEELKAAVQKLQDNKKKS